MALLSNYFFYDPRGVYLIVWSTQNCEDLIFICPSWLIWEWMKDELITSQSILIQPRSLQKHKVERIFHFENLLFLFCVFFLW